ncbi:MAG: serine/threonine protein kinase [Frankiales bacterium]|nr:serine/threonine protein kinase [Frankiales bacterium]
MGTVFLGVLPDDRAVAVKVLRDGLVDADSRRRFQQELGALQRVRGPHVVEVLEADVEADHPWIVTRFVPGCRLDHVGPLAGEELRSLARGLADALASVHEAGVVHRDVTPGNVLLVEGEPHLIDLGLAVAADLTALTRTGTVVGTAGYLSPEQVLGHPATAASDVHAWGAVVAMAATGRPPYGTGRPEAVLYRVVHEQPDVSGMQGDLRELVVRALDTDQSRRPRARELLVALGGRSDAEAVTLHLDDLTALATSVIDLTGTRRLVGVSTGPQTRLLPAEPAPNPHVVEPAPVVVRPGRLRVSLVAPSAAVALAGLGAAAPVAALVALVALLGAVQATSHAQAVHTVRRERRGARRRDPLLHVLSAPWHLLRGLGHALVGLPLAVLAGTPVAALVAVATHQQLGWNRGQALGVGLGLVVVAGVSLARRSAAGSRRLLGSAVLRATPTASAGTFVVAVLLVAGLVGTLVGPHWFPLPHGIP